MPFLRQSTSQVILFGPCLDKTDGLTEETGLTLAQADMRLSKDGGAFAQKSAAGNATHDSDGWYNTTLSTTDTATVGELRLNVHQPANMLPVWDRWWVIEEAIYDAMFGASAAGFDSNGRVDVGAVLGTAQTAGDLAALVVTADAAIDVAVADLANGTDGLTALKALIDAIPTTAMRGTDNAALASVVGALNDAAAADEVTTADTLVQYIKQLINILIGAPGIVTLKAAAAPASGVSLSEMIRAIYDDSNSLDGTKIPDTISLAAINAEVDTALDTAISELGVGIPTATPTVRTALMLMYMALRNKLVVQTSGTDALEVYNDAGTLITKKLLSDDGADYTEAEMS